MNTRTSFQLLLTGLFLLINACVGGEVQTSTDVRPEITVETIREDINGERVRVPAADGASESRSWRFERNEPKEIEIIEKQLAGDTAIITINMRTSKAPRAEKPRKLSGRLRLHYKLETGWMLRQWEIVRIDNLSFAYEKQ
ncbi:MAG: hypothetical protein M3407_11050 [Acidobacteriota bacterium]|nr:hypothetical protein [Acidobacteriota bacterium]